MRTRQEIDQEYTIIATAYGDRLFKQTLLQEEIKKLFSKMAELNLEPAFNPEPPLPPPLVEKKAENPSGKEDVSEDSKVE